MYVAITGKGKAKVIQFCEQHRIPGTSKKKTTVIKTIGNYEKLLKQNPNIIAELKEEAKQLTNLKKEKKIENPLCCQIQEDSLFRFGHILVKQLWEQLDLNTFFSSHFPEEEAKILSHNLFTLVVYRLGSSYKNFRKNRKIPFLNLKTLSEEEFYSSLEKISGLQQDLITHLNTFFSKKTLRNQEISYCHLSSYYYNFYWKDVQKQNRAIIENQDYSFSMLLFLDSYGIPLSYSLLEDENELSHYLEKWRKENGKQKLISLSQELPIDENDFFLHSVPIEQLDEEIRKKIMESHSWYIMEKHSETEEILQKELNFPWEGKCKFYIHWSKKRAFKDYLARNNRQGYFCLQSNDMNLQIPDILNIYQNIWKIEEKFSISEVNFQKNHIKGHFTLCFLCLSIIRYFQYLLGAEGKTTVPMIYANKAISNPMVFRQKEEKNIKINPLHVTNSYLKLSKALHLAPLKNIMEEKEFEINTSFFFSQEK